MKTISLTNEELDEVVRLVHRTVGNRPVECFIRLSRETLWIDLRFLDIKEQRLVTVKDSPFVVSIK